MSESASRQRLYFFWDYDITEDDLRAILRGDNEVEKAWAIMRLLEARHLTRLPIMRARLELPDLQAQFVGLANSQPDRINPQN